MGPIIQIYELATSTSRNKELTDQQSHTPPVYSETLVPLERFISEHKTHRKFVSHFTTLRIPGEGNKWRANYSKCTQPEVLECIYRLSFERSSDFKQI